MFLSNFVELIWYTKTDEWGWFYFNEASKNKYPDKTHYSKKEIAIENAKIHLENRFKKIVIIDELSYHDSGLKSRKPEEQGGKRRVIRKGEYSI